MNQQARDKILRVARALELVIAAKKGPDHTAKSLKSNFQSWIRKLVKNVKFEAIRIEDIKNPRSGFESSAIVTFKVIPKKGETFPVDIKISWDEGKQYTGTVKVGNGVGDRSVSIRATSLTQWLDRVKDSLESTIVKKCAPSKKS